MDEVMTILRDMGSDGSGVAVLYLNSESVSKIQRPDLVRNHLNVPVIRQQLWRKIQERWRLLPY